MAQNINDNLRLHAPKLLDDKAGPYASVAAALAGVPAYQRCPGLEVVIEIGGVQKKYWFDGGVADGDLVEIPGGGSGGYEPKNSIEVDADELQLVGDELVPGNNKVYGTDAAGEKGWKDDPSGGGGGHTILDGEATALTQRDDLQITGGAEVTDDALNERTVIAVHARQHSILSTDDHQADVANAGKILGFAETTGEPTAFETEEYEGTRNHYVQNTVPTIASAAEGDTWTNPDTARSFELFVDGAIKYWIEITPNKITT